MSLTIFAKSFILAGLFPGKIAATIFSLKIKVKTQVLFPFRRSGTTAGGLNFG